MTKLTFDNIISELLLEQDLETQDKKLYDNIAHFFKILFNSYDLIKTSKDLETNVQATDIVVKPNQISRTVRSYFSIPEYQSDMDFYSMSLVREEVSQTTLSELAELLNMDIKDIKSINTIISELNKLTQELKSYNTKDVNLKELISAIKENDIFNESIDFEQMFSVEQIKSQPKQFLLFVKLFNKQIYATKIDDGTDLLTSLKKININYINEATSSGLSGGRIILIQNISDYLTKLYTIFTYFIKKSVVSQTPDQSKERTRSEPTKYGQYWNERKFKNKRTTSSLYEHNRLIKEIIDNFNIIKNENVANNLPVNEVDTIILQVINKIADNYRSQYDRNINRIKLYEHIKSIFDGNKTILNINSYNTLITNIIDESSKKTTHYLPDNVFGYDLNNIPKNIRIAMTNDAIRIATKLNLKLNQNNILLVLKQIIEIINKSKNTKKQIPKINLTN